MVGLTFVPLGWLVKEEHDPLRVINLKLLLYRLVFLFAEEKVQIRTESQIESRKYLHQLTSTLFNIRARPPSAAVLSFYVVP